MTIGFIASVLVVTLTAVVAGSAFAAGPNPATSPRKAYQPVVKDLNDIDADLAAVLKRQPNKRDLKDLVERLNALTKRIDKQESRVESLLAQDPVPPSADLTAALQDVLAAASAIAEDAATELANNSGLPQEYVDAVNNVEDAAQAIADAVENSLGEGILS